MAMAMASMGHMAQSSELDLPGTEHQQDFQPTVLRANPKSSSFSLKAFTSMSQRICLEQYGNSMAKAVKYFCGPGLPLDCTTRFSGGD